MTEKQKKVLKLSIAFAVSFAVYPAANAMHIMEGYLPVGYCIAWGVICLPFLVKGFFNIRKQFQENRKAITMLAMAGAYIFVLSALKIPSVTGSCSHMTGTGLGAILFGPSTVSILGIIVLLFQAILLAHGGLTTLGANTFSMAIAGPFVAYGIYLLCRKCKVNKMAGIFLAAFLGDLFTYCVTSIQLALGLPQHPRRRVCIRTGIFGDICTDAAASGCCGRDSDRIDHDGAGKLCEAGIEIHRLFQSIG